MANQNANDNDTNVINADNNSSNVNSNGNDDHDAYSLSNDHFNSPSSTLQMTVPSKSVR